MGFNGSFRQLEREFQALHPEFLPLRLQMELERIHVIAAKTKDLIGKRVIDLGSGSVQSWDKSGPAGSVIRWLLGGGWQHPFQPWYCRILHHAGAHPVAIDIASNESEPFESHQLDLTDPSSLEIFEPESFDAANNFAFTVPTESKIAFGAPPSLKYDFGLSRRDIYDLHGELQKKIEALLKEGGTYTAMEFVFRKKRGKLVEERKLYRD